MSRVAFMDNSAGEHPTTSHNHVTVHQSSDGEIRPYSEV